MLSQFPIFDVIPTTQINILDDLQLLKCSFNEGNKRIYIFKNQLNQYEVGLNKEQYQGQFKQQFANCISNIDLQNDTKYIFRLKLQSYQSTYYQIGLMQNKNLHTQEGNKDYFYVEFKTENDKFLLSSCFYLKKYLKGKDNQLTTENQIEFRIWLNGGIFEVVDYPQQNFKIGLENEKLEKLKSISNLKFFLQLCDSNRKYVITDALIVEKFND
ncbi:hypothetical protein ABPG72_017621 [Tetrahymena utriculariae]